MSGTDDILREALADLSTSYRRDVVTDPRWIEELLAPRLDGKLDSSDPTVRAVVAATAGPFLRSVSPTDPAETTVATVREALLAGGTSDTAAAAAAHIWAGILHPDAALVTNAPTATVIDLPPAVPSAPPAGAVAPPVPPPPLSASRPEAPIDDTVIGTSFPPTPPQPPAPVAGVLGGPDAAPTRPQSRAWLWPALLGLVAAIAIVAAIVGWSRDPSKDRAIAAENKLAALDTNLVATEKTLRSTESSLAERSKQLDDAKAQIGQLSTATRAQLNGAQFPEQFTMTGKVAPGSCSLTGEACNVTAVVRSIKVTCATKPCDCVKGGCTVTSELWRTAAPVGFDPATNLFTAKGLLDGDVFRCNGVPQPTNYEFRFRISRISFSEGAWRVAGVDAELAEAAAANGDCLSGNRTYALSGPS